MGETYDGDTLSGDDAQAASRDKLVATATRRVRLVTFLMPPKAVHLTMNRQLKQLSCEA